MNRYQEKFIREQIKFFVSELRRLRAEKKYDDLARRCEHDIKFLFMLRKYLRTLAD